MGFSQLLYVIKSMNIISKGRQIWKGHFTYINEDEEGAVHEDVNTFEMELVFNKNSFSGTKFDHDTKNLFDKPITVNGFIEDKIISFIVMYPYYFYIDEEGNTVIDYETQYPGSQYEGKYNTEEKKFEGLWKIQIGDFKEGLFQDDYIEEFISGNWEMKRIS